MHEQSSTIIALIDEIAALLRQQNARLFTAESCTGGMIAAHCTDLAGSSEWFEGGVVSYSNKLKQQLLGVDADALKQYGAVSEAVAKQMAWGAVKAGQCEVSIATTGIAGPGGAVPGKPVGTVWFASVVGKTCLAERSYFSGNRHEIRTAACEHAFDILKKRLKS